MFSSIQDLGPSDPPARGNLGGAMTLLEKGFFRGEAWLTDPGTPIPLPLRWSRPQDIPPEPQPLAWWLPQGDGFTMGCGDTDRGRGRLRGKVKTDHGAELCLVWLMIFVILSDLSVRKPRAELDLLLQRVGR